MWDLACALMKTILRWTYFNYALVNKFLGASEPVTVGILCPSSAILVLLHTNKKTTSTKFSFGAGRTTFRRSSQKYYLETQKTNKQQKHLIMSVTTTTTRNSTVTVQSKGTKEQQRWKQQHPTSVSKKAVQLDMNSIAINFICSFLSAPILLLDHNIWSWLSYGSIQASWKHLPLFMILFDLVYYTKHRFMDHSTIMEQLRRKNGNGIIKLIPSSLVPKSKHYMHHKPCISFVQTYDGDAFGFFMVGIGMYVVSSITLPIPATAKLGFTFFFIILNCIIHEGEKLGNIQYPIFVSPIEHELHHVHRNCNYAAVFKLWDQIFNTYRES